MELRDGRGLDEIRLYDSVSCGLLHLPPPQPILCPAAAVKVGFTVKPDEQPESWDLHDHPALSACHPARCLPA